MLLFRCEFKQSGRACAHSFARGYRLLCFRRIRVRYSFRERGNHLDGVALLWRETAGGFIFSGTLRLISFALRISRRERATRVDRASCAISEANREWVERAADASKRARRVITSPAKFAGARSDFHARRAFANAVPISRQVSVRAKRTERIPPILAPSRSYPPIWPTRGETTRRA